MTPIALSEEAGRRFCMLSEFMLGKPVFESYKSLCSKIGNDTISYREFDFWFHRFANGKLDLGYDRSLDPKPKELSDMPIDIIEKVADYFSSMDRLIVRCVSQGLRTIVENRIARYNFVVLRIRDDNIDVYTRTPPASYSKNGTIKYKKQEEDCLMINDGVEKLVRGADPFKLAAEHLSIVLSNPEIELESMWIDGQKGNNAEVFTSFLGTALQDNMFVVNDLRLFDTSVGALLNILPCVVPEDLSRIEMEETWESDEDDAKLTEIVEMDQWKNARVLWVEGIKSSIPIESVIHSKCFAITLNDVSPQEVVRIREILFNLPHFDSCAIHTPEVYDLIAIQEALGPFTKNPARPEWQCYAIPGSTSFLAFFFTEAFFNIIRYKAGDF